MKALLVFLAGFVAFAAVLIGGGLLFLLCINEERKKRCGKCGFYDPSLGHCWARGMTCGSDDEACIGYEEKEGEAGCYNTKNDSL